MMRGDAATPRERARQCHACRFHGDADALCHIYMILMRCERSAVMPRTCADEREAHFRAMRERA